MTDVPPLDSVLVKLGLPFAKGSFSKTFLSVSPQLTQELRMPVVLVEKVFSPNLPAFGATIFRDKKKRLSLLEDLKALFESEINAMEELEHECIVPIVGRTEGEYPSIVMPFVGPDLRTISQKAQWSQADIIRFVLDATEALEHVHERGYVHGDISPRNTFFSYAAGRFVLGDFGVAQKVTASEAVRKASDNDFVTGKNAAPEMIRDRVVSQASDVWMLGYTLFDMLSAGKASRWDSRLYETIEQVNGDISVLSKQTEYRGNEDFVKLLSWCLRLDPDDRKTASELREYVSGVWSDFEYSSECVFSGQDASGSLIDYTFLGVVNGVLDAFESELIPYAVGTPRLTAAGRFIEIAQKLYPGWADLHHLVFKYAIAAHLVSGSTRPSEDRLKMFRSALENTFTALGEKLGALHAFATFSVLEDWRNEEADSQASQRLARCQDFYITLRGVVDKFTSRDGFILLVDETLNPETGNVDRSIRPLVNRADFDPVFFAISIDDWSAMRFGERKRVASIDLEEDVYSIALEDGQSEPEVPYVIASSKMFRERVHLVRLVEGIPEYGVYGTINGVINSSRNMRMRIQFLRKDTMLTNAGTFDISLKKADGYVEHIVVEELSRDGFLIGSNKLNQLVLDR